MTRPENPQAPIQRYVLTAAGVEIKADWIGMERKP
jgi:hypothetical protein